jgi:hypothetical protein
MRLIYIISFLTVANFATAQIRDFQLKGNTPKDTMYVMGTDTNSSSAKYGLGKWYKMDSLITAIAGGGSATNLSIGQSGSTQIIQSSTGTDVGVRNLYGLLITEGATDTLHFRVDTSKIATLFDITQIPISSLKAAAATNTIDNTTYKQEWKWDALGGTDGLMLSSNSTTAASDLQKVLHVKALGANSNSGQDTWAGYFSNTHSGTSSTNYGVYGIATGGTVSHGVYGSSNSASAVSNAGAGVTARNTNAGTALDAVTTGGGTGVYAESPDGYAVNGYTTGGTAAWFKNNWSTTNDYGSVIDVHRTSSGGNGATGLGAGIAFSLETSTGAVPISNQLKSVWTTATNASYVSNFIITGCTAATEADLFTLKGSGQLQLNKYVSGAFSGTAAYNLLLDASGNLIAGSVPVGSNNVTEENNSTVQSGTVTYDFQNPFDVATDGGTEVNISFDGGEFTTVTTAESDDYLLIHDSGSAANQKMLWSDFTIDLIDFLDGNVGVGTGNAIDVGEGLDINMSPSTEANINLDASEFQIDGTAEGTEYVLLHDADTTAGHQIQRRLVSSFGGSDGNGIYTGDGTVPTDVDAAVTDSLEFNGTLKIINDANDYVGIGAQTPEGKLHVRGANQAEMILEETGDAVQLQTKAQSGSTTAPFTITARNRDTNIDISGDYYTLSSIAFNKTSATVPGGNISFAIGYDSANVDQVLTVNSRESGATDGYLGVVGGLRYKWSTSASAAVTLNTGDYGLSQTFTGAKTCTLPDAVSGIVGQTFSVFNNASSGDITLTITGGSSDVFYGDVIVSINESVIVQCVAANKWIINN